MFSAEAMILNFKHSSCGMWCLQQQMMPSYSSKDKMFSKALSGAFLVCWKKESKILACSVGCLTTTFCSFSLAQN